VALGPIFVLFTAGLVSLVYGFIRVCGHGRGDTGVLACLAGGCVLLVAFVTAALGTIFTAAVRRSLHRGLAAHAAFAAGLNDLLLVTAGAALVGGLASMALIRSRDFVQPQAASAAQSSELSRPVEASA
jgi:hypothetical protein